MRCRPPLWPLLGALAAPLLLSACADGPPAVRVQNLEPARQAAQAREQRELPAPATLAAGWRVYQQRCASCHGERADGAGGGANLLLRMQGLGPQRFVDLVLRRYDDATLPLGRAADRALVVDEVVERRSGTLTMPAWQGDPVTQAHVMDLYAYLSARAAGRVGEGRPPAP